MPNHNVAAAAASANPNPSSFNTSHSSQADRNTQRAAPASGDATTTPDRASTRRLSGLAVTQAQDPARSSEISAAAVASPTYVSEGELNTKLQGLASQLRSELYGTTGNANTLPASGGVWNSIALTNNIDQLSGVTISNAAVSGISGLTDADIPDTITASNYLPLSGGTLTGPLTVSTLVASSTD